MKALSLWQPWASAMAVGAKRIETRSWPATSNGQAYRGWVAICASKTLKDENGDMLIDTFEDRMRRSPFSAGLFQAALGHQYFNMLPFGAVVAVGWLQECQRTYTGGLVSNNHPMRAPEKVTELESMWGNYAGGRYGWMFCEMWRLNEPLPVRGAQKLFDLDMPPRWQDQATWVF